MTVHHDPKIDDADISDVDEVDTPSDEQSTPRHWLRVSNRWMRAGRRWLRRRLARWRLILLAVAVVVAVGVATGLFFFQYRPDHQTDNVAARAALTAASEDAVAVLSYSPDSIDHDLAVANSHLTGQFGRYFRDFSKQFVAPAVREQDVKASATVLRAAVSQLHPDSAVVLLFIHQTTTSKDKPEPALTSSNVRVTLTKVNGSWLMSGFEPI